MDGILIPGGFGNRGIEGKIMAAEYARTNKVPFFGICLGMQILTIEFARHVCNMADANSTEFNERTEHPVIDIMEEQKKVKTMGGTMRLGAYNCILCENSNAFKAYGKKEISERHRHRFEFNSKFEEEFVKNGLSITGRDKDTSLVEIVEIKEHPWYTACQFHPEFKSKPFAPHPLFIKFIEASIQNIKKNH